MHLSVITVAMWFVRYDPREYVDFEGVLLPLNKETAIAHAVSCVLMFGFLAVVALVTKPPPRRRFGGDDGNEPDRPTLPAGPRWSSGRHWPISERFSEPMEDETSESYASRN